MWILLKEEKDMFYEVIWLNQRRIKVTWYERKDKKHILTVKWKYKTCECPLCMKKTSKRDWLHEVTMKPLWKHLLLSDGNMMELKLIRRAFRCPECKISFMERFEFEAEKWERTKAFDDYVKFSRWHMSGSQIARNTQCSAWLIHDILKDIDENELNKRWIEIMRELDEIYLWIDEHSFKGRDMVLVITDIKAKKVLAILEEITNEALSNWFKSLDSKIKEKIKWISTDMNKWYKNIAEQKIEWIVGTVDKYHLVQEANKMVNDVRMITIWLIKMWFMKAEDFIKNKKVTKKLLTQKKGKKKERKSNIWKSIKIKKIIN